MDLLFHWPASWADAAGLVVLVIVLGICVVTDLRTRRIPDVVVIPGVAVTLGVRCALGTAPWWVVVGWAAVAGAVLMVPALVRPEAMGMGDAKLAVLIGAALGPAAVGALLVALVAGCVGGLTWAAAHGRRVRGTAVPFAPFLAVGAVVAVVLPLMILPSAVTRSPSADHTPGAASSVRRGQIAAVPLPRPEAGTPGHRATDRARGAGAPGPGGYAEGEMALTYRTAGESHGPALTTIVEGLPSGLPLTPNDIDADLARRQLGYGRGGRQKIETDRVQVTAGIRHGHTLGSPVALMVMNRDFANWSEDRMAIWEPASEVAPITLPRPGHADLAGMQKYETNDLRNILERASARETAARVAAGGVAKALIRRYGMEVRSHVVQVGPEAAPVRDDLSLADFEGVDESPVRALDADASVRMRAAIKAAGQDSDTLGGIFEVWVFDPIPGLGSHVSGDARLDGRIGQAVLGIQAIKGVEIGAGFELGRIRGSAAHDEIFWNEEKGYHRRTNRSGGLEGGMTHGAPLVVRAAMKPIATLSRPLASVNVQSKEATSAFKERADICAVPAAAVIAEAVIAFVLAQALVEKFGGDSVASLDAAVERYRGVLAQ
ncbi:MAG: chorismate synthase [Thermoleophilia bacterium]|nr:chorismate synthase [Thermoleophilia bacterium]